MIFIDPPSGWMYGFPKELPPDWEFYNEGEKENWFFLQGYPADLIEKGYLNHCRTWYDES